MKEYHSRTRLKKCVKLLLLVSEAGGWSQIFEIFHDRGQILTVVWTFSYLTGEWIASLQMVFWSIRLIWFEGFLEVWGRVKIWHFSWPRSFRIWPFICNWTFSYLTGEWIKFRKIKYFHDRGINRSAWWNAIYTLFKGAGNRGAEGAQAPSNIYQEGLSPLKAQYFDFCTKEQNKEEHYL